MERDQEFLLPPNMTDWLPEGHLAWFVIDAVGVLDTSALHSRAARRRDGRARRSSAGRAGYDPDMLLTLLIYAYACGERSSRRIERLCATDVAFRLICAGDVPDHSVITRFLKVHAEAFAGLFVQVLRLCREVGPARLGTVAIDGTKIKANASLHADRGEEWLRTQAEKTDARSGGSATTGSATTGETTGSETTDRENVAAILVEVAEIDRAEEGLFGADTGEQLPQSRHGREGRQVRIRAALARIQARQQVIATEKAAKAAKTAAARAERDAADLTTAQAASAAELATREATQHAWEQAWEHAVNNPGAPVARGRAPMPAEESAVVRRAQQRVDRARERVEHPESAPRPGGSRPRTPDQPKRGSRWGRRDPDQSPWADVTDPDSSIMPTKDGWTQGYNAQFAYSADQILLVGHISTNPADVAGYDHMVTATATTDTVALLGATDELGPLLFDTGYCSDATLAAPSPDRLIALGKIHSVLAAARDNPATGPPPEGATPRQVMDHRLRTPDGAKLYTRRGATVEPGIGNFTKLLDRFSRRGLAAVQGEFNLAATAFNLLKIHRAAPT